MGGGGGLGMQPTHLKGKGEGLFLLVVKRIGSVMGRLLS